jgi:hypothetical protein
MIEEDIINAITTNDKHFFNNKNFILLERINDNIDILFALYICNNIDILNIFLNIPNYKYHDLIKEFILIIKAFDHINI